MTGPGRRTRWGSFPTTADVGIWVRASSPRSVFEGLGLALFAQMTDLRKVRATSARTVTASGADPTALTVAFLTALLNLHADDGFLVRRLEVGAVGDPPTSLLAQAWGEPFDPARHSAKVEVKAVTFHQLEIDVNRGTARVILDI